MKIELQTNFGSAGLPSPEEPLPSKIKTILDLLRYMETQIGFMFVDADGMEIRQDIEVIVNGKEVWFYPAGLRTPLKDGDLVEIRMMPLGGG